MSSKCTVRLANRENPFDRQALAQLTRDVPMRGALDVAQEREDFFAIEAAIGAPLDAYVAEIAGEIIGCGAIAIRNIWTSEEGPLARVGHIGDLRVLPAYRGRGVFSALARHGFEDAMGRHGITWATTAILARNRIANAASSRVWPPVRALAPYRMQTLLATRARDVSRRATDADAAELVAFLDACNRRPLGTPWTRNRLAQCPWTLSDWHLIERNGELVAAGAWWRPDSQKRVRIHRYGPAAPLRLAWNARPGNPRIPPAGSCVPMAYGMHLEAVDRSSAHALRDALLMRTRQSGTPLLGVLETRSGPWKGVARGRPSFGLDVMLHSVGNAPEVAAWHPGVEVALA